MGRRCGVGRAVLSLADWAGATDSTVQLALARLEALPHVEHGVEPPFEIGDKATYHAGHEGHLSKQIREAPIRSVPLQGLRTIQHSVNPERVRQYIEDPELLPGARHGAVGSHGGPVDLPIIVRQQGTMWVHDGHHRLCAAKLSGDTSAKVRFVDLDKK
jgi:hypothetical protein